MRHLVLILVLCAVVLPQELRAQESYQSDLYEFSLVPLGGELNYPWGMDFVPDGSGLLVTEKSGQLYFYDTQGWERREITGLPEIAEIGQGGLLDVMAHPDFENNQVIFLSHAARDERGYGTEVIRARIDGSELKDVQTIFTALPKVRGRTHFGSRLLWGPDDKLYITLGERGQMDEAQQPINHLGTTIRINEDGSVPQDNPFAGHERYRPEIFTYGNRNVQGIILHPERDEVWIHEHGPKGGDEINILKAGANYGWPEVTHGVAYSGFEITDKTSAPGVEPPILHWTPSIAPSGMSYYDGDQFPKWQGDIFVGALVERHLRRVSVSGNKVVGQEVLLEDLGERIRDVATGPDGYIYLLLDKSGGALMRLEPKD